MAAVLLFLAACTPAQTAKDGRPVVAAAFYPVYLAALNLTDDVEVELNLLTKPDTGCLHDYQLTPAELESARTADLLLAVGGGMEAFLGRVVESCPELKVVDCSEGVPLIEEEGHGYNAHYWVCVTHYMTMTGNILDALTELDPDNSDAYRRNYQDYMDKLSILESELESIGTLGGKSIVTFHEAFDYWEEPYGLDIAATIAEEPGTEPSAGDLAAVINIVNTQNVAALFAERQYTDSAARVISGETGVPVYLLDPVASGPENDRDYYQSVMRENLKTLNQALK